MNTLKLKPIDDFLSLSKFQLMFLGAMIVTMTSLSVYWNDSVISMLSGITGVICVFLVNMRKLSNFIWGLANAVLYGYVAYQASYYGDVMLNWFFYLPFQLIGFYFWNKNMEGDEVKSRALSAPIAGIMILVACFTVMLYNVLLTYLGGKLTVVDATSTVLSVMATFLMVKGYREQWVCWIIVNIVSIIMWYVNFMNGGETFGVLIMWVMFLLNSIYGCYNWFKVSK